MTAKRFLHEDDKLELQNEISNVRTVAESSNKTVQEVSVIAQEAANTALNAANRIVNLNLLHNWYFGNPVNRNGKTEYDNGMASGYTIDRWWQLFTKYDVETQTLAHSTSTQYGGAFRQPVDYPERFAGKTVTISLLAESVNGNCQLVLVKGTGINTGLVTVGGITLKNGINSFTVPIPTDVGSSFPLLIVSVGVPIGGSVKLHAIKIEVGNQQTLAHLENGVWVLNEIPDYAEQMAICMQYDKSSGAYLGKFDMTASDVGALSLIGDVTKINPVSDLNNFQNGLGLFSTSTVTNLPDDDSWWVVLSGGSKYSNTILQIAFALNKRIMKWRAMASGNWGNWGDANYHQKTSDGNLHIKKTSNALIRLIGENIGRHAYFEMGGTGRLYMMNAIGENDASTQTGIVIDSPAKELKNRVVIYDKVEDETASDGFKRTEYNIFGEHNITKGTTDIGAGSAMTSLIHLVYEE